MTAFQAHQGTGVNLIGIAQAETGHLVSGQIEFGIFPASIGVLGLDLLLVKLNPSRDFVSFGDFVGCDEVGLSGETSAIGFFFLAWIPAELAHPGAGGKGKRLAFGGVDVVQIGKGKEAFPIGDKTGNGHHGPAVFGSGKQVEVEEMSGPGFPLALDQARFIAAGIGKLVGDVAGPVVDEVSVKFQVFTQVPLETDAVEIIGHKLCRQAAGKHEVIFAEWRFVGNGGGENASIEPGFAGKPETHAGFHKQAGFRVGVIGFHIGSECRNDAGPDFFGGIAEVEVSQVDGGLVGNGVVYEGGKGIGGLARAGIESPEIGIDVGFDLDFSESLSAGGIFHHAGVGLGIGLGRKPKGKKREKQKSAGCVHGRRK